MRGRERPYLRSLQIFDAVGRHRSITAAASELGVTQSAVSHQIRRLQEHIGENLVERQGRTIVLTPAGSRLAASLDAAFGMLDQSMNFVGGASRPVLRVGIYSSFAEGWLVPRYAGFARAHPDIDLRLVMLYDPHEVSARLADVFVTSEPVPAGYRSIRLFTEKLVPVVAAAVAEPDTLITSEVEPALAGRDWEAFSVLNDRPAPTQPMICTSHYVVSLQMVRAALGASLIPSFLAEPHLRSGELRRLDGKPLPTGQTYQVQFKYVRQKEPEFVAFVDWLRGQVSDDALLD